jgi:hypothetical protein
MAAVSFSIGRGADDDKIANITIGTLAPNANDFEFRYNYHGCELEQRDQARHHQIDRGLSPSLWPMG